MPKLPSLPVHNFLVSHLLCPESQVCKGWTHISQAGLLGEKSDSGSAGKKKVNKILKVEWKHILSFCLQCCHFHGIQYTWGSAVASVLEIFHPLTCFRQLGVTAGVTSSDRPGQQHYLLDDLKLSKTSELLVVFTYI